MGARSIGTRGVAVAALLWWASVALPFARAADVRLTPDYGAVVIEAEAHRRGHERWVPTDPLTAQRGGDPDGNHSDGASGQAYLELLPDTYVREGDRLDPSSAAWHEPGRGPSVLFPVSFPEPGRYHVHVRAYVSGAHDGAIHIGLDGRWPESGAALQLCDAAASAWRWSSARRGSGGRHCGIEGTAWLTVETAGEHTVAIAALDDGFEIDRLMLIRDRSNGRRRCAPAFDRADEIVCTEGGIEASDGVVDLGLTLVSSAEAPAPGDAVTVEATLVNRDPLDEAEAVRLRVDLDTDAWRVQALDRRCLLGSDRVSCAFERLPVAGAGGESVTMVLEPLEAGVLRIDAAASARQPDLRPDDDVARLDVDVREALGRTRLVASLGGLPGVIETARPGTLSFSVANTGQAPALEAQLSLMLPAGFDIVSTSAECVPAAPQVHCAIGTLDAGRTRAFTVTTATTVPGGYAIGAAASARNAEDSNAVSSLNVIASLSRSPESPAPICRLTGPLPRERAILRAGPRPERLPPGAVSRWKRRPRAPNCVATATATSRPSPRAGSTTTSTVTSTTPSTTSSSTPSPTPT